MSMAGFRALTVCQPFAELIARGDKPIENRTWATPYRGPLVIHAGKSTEWMEWLPQYPQLKGAALTFGAAIAVADLVDCLSTALTEWPEPYASLRAHEHANGPVCWILQNIRRLHTPVPCGGAQYLWTPDTVKAAAIQRQIAP